MVVDPNIKKKADDIRTKVYGREVRESLASGLEEMSSDVVETVGRQDEVESQWQNVVDETTGKDVISAPEIIAARDGEANLKARLDKEHEKVTTQLAQRGRLVTEKVDDIHSVDDWIPIINDLILEVHNGGGGDILFPSFPNFDYIVKPSGDSHCVTLLSNVNLIGLGKPTIKVSDNNEHFYRMIVGELSHTENNTIRGFIFDTNFENNDFIVSSGAGRGVLGFENADNLTIENNVFRYESVSCIYIFGARKPLENTIIRDNQFIFNSDYDGTFDNTAVYVATQHHKIYNNRFISLSDIGRTAIETHVSSGDVFNNHIENYQSGVLLQAQDLPESSYLYDVKDVKRKVIGNTFERVVNGITFWTSMGSNFKGVIIKDNVINIANLTKNYNPISDCYGIALASSMGGSNGNHTIEDLIIADNVINFEFDSDNIQSVNPENYELYVGSFGIGAHVSTSSQLFKVTNALINRNIITNSPMAPFSFVDSSSSEDSFTNVVIKDNLIENSITYIQTSINQRSALYISGDTINFIFEENTIIEPKEKNTLLREAMFAPLSYKTDNGKIGKNNIQDKSNKVTLYSDLNSSIQRAKSTDITPDLVTLGTFTGNNSGTTVKLGGNILTRTPTGAGGVFFTVTESGTLNNQNVNGDFKGNQFIVGSPSDVNKFKGGDIVQIKDGSETLAYTKTVIGIDPYINAILLSGNEEATVSGQIVHKRPITQAIV